MWSLLALRVPGETEQAPVLHGLTPHPVRCREVSPGNIAWGSSPREVCFVTHEARTPGWGHLSPGPVATPINPGEVILSAGNIPSSFIHKITKLFCWDPSWCIPLLDPVDICKVLNLAVPENVTCSGGRRGWWWWWLDKIVFFKTFLFLIWNKDLGPFPIFWTLHNNLYILIITIQCFPVPSPANTGIEKIAAGHFKLECGSRRLIFQYHKFKKRRRSLLWKILMIAAAWCESDGADSDTKSVCVVLFPRWISLTLCPITGRGWPTHSSPEASSTYRPATTPAWGSPITPSPVEPSPWGCGVPAPWTPMSPSWGRSMSLVSPAAELVPSQVRQGGIQQC